MNKTAITGMGVISSAGTNLTDFWNTLFQSTVTYKEIPEYKVNKNFRTHIGAQVQDSTWQKNLTEIQKQSFGKAALYAISASRSALENANIDIDTAAQLRTAVVLSTTMGEIQTEEELSEIRHQEGFEKIPKNLLQQYRTDHIASAVSSALQLSGPTYMVPAACAGGNYAVGLGKKLLEWNLADIVIAGGVDVFSRVAFTGFQRLLSLSPDLCKPFDRERKGLILGEGCGIVILEREDCAQARNAKIHGILAGVGLTADRHHMTAPHPDGDGAVRAIRQAMQEAEVTEQDIDYISAHGTGTVSNDKTEVKALETVFSAGNVPPLSSIKSMIGHPMGAAGAIELIACLQMLENNILLPTIHYETPDPACNVDCVPNTARKAKISCILSNSLGFGGQSSSIIIARE